MQENHKYVVHLLDGKNSMKPSYAEVAAADKTEDGGEDDKDEGMRIMLQASAALEVARIQRMTRVGGDNPIGSTVGIGGSKNNDLKRDNVNEVSYYSSDDESFLSYTLETGDA